MRILKSAAFEKWASKNAVGAARIAEAMLRVATLGRPCGDWKVLEPGLFEQRIHSGPGYRAYYALRGDELVVLFIGGTKRTQSRDIATARSMYKRWKETGDGRIQRDGD